MPRPRRFFPALGAPPPTAAEQALAEWRGVHLEALEKARKPGEKSAAAVMPRVLADLRLDQRMAESQIQRVWAHLIDPTLTAHAQPRGLRNGTLFVTVDSHVWLEEIVRYRRREILERLQHSFGKKMIQKISFSVG